MNPPPPPPPSRLPTDGPPDFEPCTAKTEVPFEFKFRTPKPNYLPHISDRGDDYSIIDQTAIPLQIHGQEAYDNYYSQCERQALEMGIEKPRGRQVSFHCNPEMEKHHFGKTHPMKPWRLTLSKSLITSYGMMFAMNNYLSRAATYEELHEFHSAEYLDFLATVPSEAVPREYTEAEDIKHSLGGSDCPIFEGVYDYASMSAGGSIDAARKICNGQSEIAISWGGGLHHAKKNEASGFCYINDIVLAILQLLRYYPRVLYVDIDVHHGDGVEEAFWSSDRVMTCSFHKYDPNNFFPGTGALDDNGPRSEHNPGAHHAVNVPLSDGITDEQYKELFQSVISKIIQTFRPSAIALQCGADSLAGDRLGRFNLQVQGHGACVEYIKSLNIPMIMFGGGGYTPRNVARAWAYETSVAIGYQDVIKANPIIPMHTPWRKQFRQESLLPTVQEILGEPRPNKNTPKKINDIISHISEQLRFVNAAPSVQMQDIPKGTEDMRADVERMMAEEMLERDDNMRKRKEKAVGTPLELV